jgi:hypothetical protein
MSLTTSKVPAPWAIIFDASPIVCTHFPKIQAKSDNQASPSNMLTLGNKKAQKCRN